MTALCAAPGCDAPVQDATVCSHCAGRLEEALGDVPALWADLELTLTRQGVISQRAGGRSAETPVPWDQRASDASWVLRNTLSTWMRDLAHEREYYPPDRIDGITGWLLSRIERIRHHPAGGECVDEILEAVANARRAVDRPAGRWYLAPCDHCDTDLYAKAGARWARCGVCGAEYDVHGRKQQMRHTLEDQLFGATDMADVLRHLGVSVTPAMVRGYAHRGRLTARGGERPLYRVGDVLDILMPRQACA